MSTDSSCRAVRSSGTCDCSGFVESTAKWANSPLCAVEGCGHTSTIHNGHKARVNAPASASVSTPASEPATKPDKPSKAPSRAAEPTSTGEVTTAMMRAWARAQGISVGERGRLMPDIKARALAALSTK